MIKKILTLALVVKENEVLLGMKKRGFGMGWWNGFGGKVEPGESIVEAAKREMREESNVEIVAMEEIGLIDFYFVGNPIPWEVHLFKVSEYSGEPVESEEMLPKWFPLENPPFDKMWADDPVWYPYFLRGERFNAEFWFDENKKVEKFNIEKI